MKIAVVAFLAALAFAQATPISDIFSDEYIRQINAKATTWTAGRNFPRGTTLADVKRLLGARKPSKNVLHVKIHPDQDVPESFDARVQWPNCSSIRLIRDQAACGCCWATATTSCISDRICIHRGKEVLISASDLISCCAECGDGCDGGWPDQAWAHYRDVGLPSGGEYNSGVGCKPFPYAPCGDDWKGETPCPDDGYPTLPCVKKCDTNGMDYEKDLHKGKSAYKVAADEKQMQIELMTKGTIEITFDVYSDFMQYKEGIYQKIEGAEYMGGHAVRIVGWGVVNGTPYWTVTNSWNTHWGDKGIFKIIRGRNECGCESDVSAGMPEDK